MTEPERAVPRIAGFLGAMVLALHLAAGIGALVMLPRGFAVDDLHLWSNTVIPALSSLAVVGALVMALWRRSVTAVRLLVAASAGGWLAAVITGAVLFPLSMPPSRWIVPALGALVLLLLAWVLRHRTSAIAVVVGAALGLVVILAQRAPLPSTRPLGGTLPDVGAEPSPAGVEHVVVPCGRHHLRVNPLLTFVSRSPDRTWTILAPDPLGSPRTVASHMTTKAGFEATFVDDGKSTLVVRQVGHLEIEAMTSLEAPVYSHLNSFTMIQLPFEATISFGPTGTTRFPIEPADYPTGRPSKLAYLDDDAFHVVRASDGEKGPYTELARGPLRRGEPLALEIRPLEGPGCRLVFEDWSAQVSTEPSPTAGWGVAQNSIQFFVSGTTGLVVLALAETGPGRGFNSVGHPAGTYRNRLTVHAIE